MKTQEQSIEFYSLLGAMEDTIAKLKVARQSFNPDDDTQWWFATGKIHAYDSAVKALRTLS